jgi:hypothetical protein
MRSHIIPYINLTSSNWATIAPLQCSCLPLTTRAPTQSLLPPTILHVLIIVHLAALSDINLTVLSLLPVPIDSQWEAVTRDRPHA